MLLAMTNEHLSRRGMLKQLGVIIGVAAGFPVPARTLARTQGLTAISNALITMTPAEAETLRAIIVRIIPADENGPGALEARADRFIDRALGGALKNLRPIYGDGLTAVNSYAQSLKGMAFAKLSSPDQDAVLTAMEQNQATG